jgi:hypothetical protein
MAVRQLSLRRRPSAARRRRVTESKASLKRRTTADTFLTEGVVAHVDEWGVERFNFPQQIWLYPHIAMGCQAAAPRQVLAINVLSRLIRGSEVRVVVGATSRRALQLAPAFIEECLSARQAHWTRYTIPISALRAWVARNR